MQTTTYNAGIYTRLSRDDERMGESVSIENQKEMLTRYVREQGWNLVSTYVDDGVSGTTFDRPGLNEMISDARKGKINLIVVKDLSRFGRDYIETGKYIDVIFPSLGCRFIALNDGVDTIHKDNEMIMIFKNVMNDFYARDTSSKIKSVRQSTCKTGKYIGCYAPYGYIKDPQDTHRFIVDEPAAAVVRKIFSLRCKGLGFRKIAQTLNEAGILPPREYYYQALGKVNPHRQNGMWNDVTIRKLLRNEVYIGHMVQNKRGHVSYKNHKQVDKPKEEWIKVENTHPAIIDMDTWELAQEIDKMHSHPRYNSLKEISLFGGMLYCMDCGFAMRHQTERHKRKSGSVAVYESYLCGNYSRSGHAACSTHTIYLKPLVEVVLDDIRTKAEIADCSEAEMVRRMTEYRQSQSAQETAATKKNVKAIRKRLGELEKLVQSTYEDKVKGLIPEAVCIELLNKYQTERAEKTAQLRELERQIEDSQTVQNDVQEWVSLIRQYRNLESLDRETLLRLIDKIEIGEQTIVDGQKEREIKIYYKFVGYIG